MKLKILTFSMIIVLFLVIGLLFEIPVKKITEEKTVYQPIEKIINQTIEVPVEIPEEKITTQGVGVYNKTEGGEIVKIDIILKLGEGSILLEVSEKVFGTDFQESLETIKKYAEQYTNKSLESRDLIIKINSTTHEIQGVSGSAAITIGLIALMQNKTLDEKKVITGGLGEEGVLLRVEALERKILVAENAGLEKILIPQIQCNEVNKTREIDVVCVNSISEAVKEMVK